MSPSGFAIPSSRSEPKPGKQMARFPRPGFQVSCQPCDNHFGHFQITQAALVTSKAVLSRVFCVERGSFWPPPQEAGRIQLTRFPRPGCFSPIDSFLLFVLALSLPRAPVRFRLRAPELAQVPEMNWRGFRAMLFQANGIYK